LEEPFFLGDKKLNGGNPAAGITEGNLLQCRLTERLIS
jgi:hypothetical protein